MADQKRWFKLWDSAASDEKLLLLPPALRWAWACLGAHTQVHGDNGVITVSNKNTVLAAKMGVDVCDLERVISVLPNITLRRLNQDNGNFVVTWNNWRKYQKDSTGYARLKKFRKRRNDNDLRGEEKRGEEKIPPIVPQGDMSELTPLAKKWNETCQRLPRVQVMGKERRRKEALRLREFGAERLASAIERISLSAFCLGSGPTGWRATYEWLIHSEENVAKVLEGKYDNHKQRPATVVSEDAF